MRNNHSRKSVPQSRYCEEINEELSLQNLISKNAAGLLSSTRTQPPSCSHFSPSGELVLRAAIKLDVEFNPLPRSLGLIPSKSKQSEFSKPLIDNGCVQIQGQQQVWVDFLNGFQALDDFSSKMLQIVHIYNEPLIKPDARLSSFLIGLVF